MAELAAPQYLGREVILRKYGKQFYWERYLVDSRPEEFLCFSGTVVPVIGMAITKKGTIVIVKQFRYGTGEFVCEFPGGCPEIGQTPEEAFRMEIDQEIGYEPAKVQLVGEPIAFEPAACGTKYQIALATGCEYRHPPILDKNELIEVIEMPIAEFIMAARHRHLPIDSKTAAITFLTLPLLGLK